MTRIIGERRGNVKGEERANEDGTPVALQLHLFGDKGR
jgi:hypothetical protein